MMYLFIGYFSVVFANIDLFLYHITMYIVYNMTYSSNINPQSTTEFLQ